MKYIKLKLYVLSSHIFIKFKRARTQNILTIKCTKRKYIKNIISGLKKKSKGLPKNKIQKRLEEFDLCKILGLNPAVFLEHRSIS